MKLDGDTKTFRTWAQQNFIWLFGIIVTLANVYIASLLQPIESDYSALAARILIIEQGGSPITQQTVNKVEAIKETLDEVKAAQIRLEQKIDRHFENSSTKQ